MLPTPVTDHVDIEQVYEPSEDSYLLLDLLHEEASYINSRFRCPVVLELGVGSGVVSTFVHKHVVPLGIFIGTDMNPYACSDAARTSMANGGTEYFEAIRTDLWLGIRPNLVDVLIFNPPYVPDEFVPSATDCQARDDWLDLALSGGTDGMETTTKVLDNLGKILSSRGIAYILFCGRNKPSEVADKMCKQGWKATVVGQRRAGWEALSVWRFQRPAE
ncbi:S-adenosyl-L-methionine-dependent methyltransferase [Dipodascopsis tothii]|uniref:S-adenosyl-L-methionine-dependent methyltransferase n=1 Tax=Dipodascopsis tothii TaxID=44089 RepID=UPI0034CD8068